MKGAHVAPSDALTDALPELAETPEHQVPVVENGVLVGMLFEADVSKLLSRGLA